MLETKQLEDITKKAIKLVKQTGNFIRNEVGKFKADKIEFKDQNTANMVTNVDKTAEKQLIDGLSEILPESGFIAEEGTSSVKHDVYNWIIDPLDGTTNFIHRLPPYAISVALAVENEIVAGIVYEISADECFYAWKNAGAWLNEAKISVSEANDISKSLIATGFPYADHHKLSGILKTVEYFVKYSHGIRRLGSAATDLAYVACGRLDGFFEVGLNPWDVAAGAILVKEAGGIVNDFSGNDNFIFGREIIATNNKINTEFSKVVKSFLC